MVNKASGLPSGFGKFYANEWIFDGQFNEGKFHGHFRYVTMDHCTFENWIYDR